MRINQFLPTKYKNESKERERKTQEENRKSQGTVRPEALTAQAVAGCISSPIPLGLSCSPSPVTVMIQL